MYIGNKILSKKQKNKNISKTQKDNNSNASMHKTSPIKIFFKKKICGVALKRTIGLINVVKIIKNKETPSTPIIAETSHSL